MLLCSAQQLFYNLLNTDFTITVYRPAAFVVFIFFIAHAAPISPRSWDGFGDMTIVYRVLLFKIGNGAGDLDYPVIGTGTKTELFKNLLQERLRCS